MKPPSFAPSYLWLYPILAETANKHGYALAVHGSLTRDFDLIAVPWVKGADTPESLYAAIVAVSGNYIVPQNFHTSPTVKEHNRLCWSICLECGAYIDFSVMMPVLAREKSDLDLDSERV